MRGDNKIIAWVIVVILTLNICLPIYATPVVTPSGQNLSSTTQTQLRSIESEVKDALDHTTSYILNKVKKPTVGSIGGEWAVLGLARRGVDVPKTYYEDYYKCVVEKIKQEEAKATRKWGLKVTETQRLAIALTAIGKDPMHVAGIDLIEYSWNKEKKMSDLPKAHQGLGDRQGLNELVFGLITIDLKQSTRPKDATISRNSIIEKILKDYRTKDGGFSLSKNGAKADMDMTAMTLQALAPYYNQKNYEYVTKAVDKALKLLSQKQSKSGGFISEYGLVLGEGIETSESTAQVIVALCSLGIDPQKDARFIKNGKSPIDALMEYYVSGGGFRHLRDGKIDQMATEQAYYALVAYERLLKGQTSLYDMTDIKVYK